MKNNWIQNTYKAEIDLLPIQTRFYHNIDTLKDELIIQKEEFKLLPKLKFIRGKDTKITLSTSIVERWKITIPFTIHTEIIYKDCTKFHNDYIEYEVRKKVYDKSINNFITKKLNGR